MIDVHQLLSIAGASLLLVACASSCFRRNPTTRRCFILLGGAMLVALPAAIGVSGLVWWLPVPSGTYDAVSALSLTVPAELIWTALIGAGVLICWRLMRFVLARQQLLSLPEITDFKLQQLIHEYRELLGVRTAVSLREGAQPCASSGFRPVLVLPVDWRHWSQSTLKSVVLHELVHIRRRDDMCLLSVQLVSDVLWFLPWLCLLPGQLERAIEESCDDHATFHQHPGSYLEGLTTVARGGSTDTNSPIPAMARHHLLSRMTRFLQVRHSELNSAGIYWVLVTLAVTLCLSWSVKLEEHSNPSDGLGRVVAIAAPGSEHRFDLTLAHEERAPPSPLRRLAD